jgi:hypothetical protein
VAADVLHSAENLSQQRTFGDNADRNAIRKEDYIVLLYDASLLTKGTLRSFPGSFFNCAISKAN